MKYLRIILALIAGGIFFSFGLGILKVLGLLDFSIISRPFMMISVISLVPFLNITFQTWKNPLPKLEGIKENALLLNCSYEKNLNINIQESKNKIKGIANSLIFKDNLMFLDFEEENRLEFYIGKSDQKNLLNEKKEGSFIYNSNIIVDFLESNNSTHIKIVVSSENPINLRSNCYNREILNAFINNLEENQEHRTIAST